MESFGVGLGFMKGVALDSGAELFCGAQHGGDADAEASRDELGDDGRDALCEGWRGSEDDVATLDVVSDIGTAGFDEKSHELFHGQRVLAAHVDPAEQGDVKRVAFRSTFSGYAILGHGGSIREFVDRVVPTLTASSWIALGSTLQYFF